MERQAAVRREDAAIVGAVRLVVSQRGSSRSAASAVLLFSPSDLTLTTLLTVLSTAAIFDFSAMSAVGGVCLLLATTFCTGQSNDEIGRWRLWSMQLLIERLSFCLIVVASLFSFCPAAESANRDMCISVACGHLINSGQSDRVRRMNLGAAISVGPALR